MNSSASSRRPAAPLAALVAALALAACSDPSPAAGEGAAAKSVPVARTLTPPWPSMDKATALAARPDAKNYYVVFDASGSMNDKKCADGGAKIEVAKKAIATFAQAIPADSNFGLLAFDGRIAERIPLSADGARQLGPVLDRIAANGGTPLRTSITRAFQALTQQARRQLGYGEYHLVVVTDGEFTPDTENPGQIVADIVGSSPVVIHTVGFCIDAKHSLNQPGRVLYTSANSPQELGKGLQGVLAEAPSFAVSSFKP